MFNKDQHSVNFYSKKITTMLGQSGKEQTRQLEDVTREFQKYSLDDILGPAFQRHDEAWSNSRKCRKQSNLDRFGNTHPLHASNDVGCTVSSYLSKGMSKARIF